MNGGKRLAGKNPFVAILDETIAGMAELEADGFVDYFYVHPAFQRRGVGSRLMEGLMKEARRMALNALKADVSLTAKTFFEAMGFTVTEVRDNIILGHPAPNFTMRKTLSA